MFPFSDIGVDESRSLTDNLARFYDILAENALDETEKHGLLECLLYLQRQESIGFQRRTFVDLTGNHGRVREIALYAKHRSMTKYYTDCAGSWHRIWIFACDIDRT